MIYMGIDGSTTSTGVAVFDDKDLLYYDCIKPKSKDWRERISYIADELQEVFKEYDIDTVYIEDVPLKDGKPTIKKLSAVHGAVIALCALNMAKMDAESVSDWRENAGFYDGTRKGLKRDIMKQKAIKEVKELFDIDVNDDIAEAILIAYRTRYPKPLAFGRRMKGGKK